MFLENSTKVVITLLLLIITTFNNCKLLSVSELRHVYCNKDFISVQLPATSNHSELFIKTAYWQNLHLNATRECQHFYQPLGITFTISFQDFVKCGFERSRNKRNNRVSYYQNLVVFQNQNSTTKVYVKCSYKTKKAINRQRQHNRSKRSVLPDDFQEEADIEVLDTVEQKAPEPQVLMEVRQNGALIDGLVNVIPGTPLIMEIKLNEMATKIYGLKVNYMQVSDMAEMSETILFRGCTVDPYLFGNFNLTANNSLAAKFRAFKFPNTAFVQFHVNVQICLKKCMEAQCVASSASRELRKRRELPKHIGLYEVHTNFVLRIQEDVNSNEAELQTLKNHVNLLHIKNLQLFNLK